MSRAQKCRTIPKHQLALALEYNLDSVYGYSFALINLDIGNPDQEVDDHAAKVAEIEYWYGHRTDIEELNRSAKPGTTLRHASSVHHTESSNITPQKPLLANPGLRRLNNLVRTANSFLG